MGKGGAVTPEACIRTTGRAPPFSSQYPSPSALFLDEGFFDDEVAGVGLVAFYEAAGFQHGLQF